MELSCCLECSVIGSLILVDAKVSSSAPSLSAPGYIHWLYHTLIKERWTTLVFTWVSEGLSCQQAAEDVQKAPANFYTTRIKRNSVTIKPKLGPKIVRIDIGKGFPEVIKCMRE